MWMTLSRKTQVTILIAIALATFSFVQLVAEWIATEPPSPLKLTSIIVFIAATIFVAMFNYCWRWFWKKIPILAKLIYPDLHGTWTGVLQTTWKDPKTGLTPGPIETTVWIRQSLLSISIRQQTKESVSWSTREFPSVQPESDRYFLWYSYDNKPHANVSSVSSDHEGVCSLEINLQHSREALRGQYYTSRKTSGNLQITRKSRSIKTLKDREIWESGALFHEFREQANNE
jgi:hypothetical protein